MMVYIILLTYLGSLLLAQTVYPDRTFFDLTIANDGRVEALINANDAKWMTNYRQFIELNPDTRELMITFDVAASEYPTISSLKSESHIMSSVIGSGEISWGFSQNVTTNPEGYIHSNMILWYDQMMKEMVMIYQSSSYWYWSKFLKNWDSATDLDAYDQTLQIMRLTEEGWSEPVQILKQLANPHVHFQIIESLDLNEEGFPREIMLPVHHLSESTANENYEMIVRTDRSMSVNNMWDIRFMSATKDGGEGFLQASIVRVPGENELGSSLVAFLRDANGQWVYRSTSDDDGFSWTDPLKTAIPNPDQMSQALYLHSGLLMLIYNPSQSMSTEPSGDRYSNCHHLAIGLSADYGLTWQHSRMIEYAYDGMFNYPVALQDPECSHIYLTYSVETNEQKGCSMLKECTIQSQNTLAYIKFTIITENWVMNDFDYRYESSEKCTWELSPYLEFTAGFQTSALEESERNTVNLSVIIILLLLLCLFATLNAICCYFLCIKQKLLEYNDLESSNKTEMKTYRTTTII